jgi:hypothetical protein
MSACDDNKLIEMLADIQSDVRQIKSDLQLILKQTVRSSTEPSSVGDQATLADLPLPSDANSAEDVLRFFRETRGQDDFGTTSGRVTDFERRPKAD